MIDLAQFDAAKRQPSTPDDANRAFANHRQRLAVVAPRRTTKRAYLAACMAMSADWLRRSHNAPSPYMTATDLRLHRLALRKKGETL